VRNIFIHRRKFLRSALVSAVKPDLDKPAVDEIMKEMEFDAQTRAEQLAPQRLLELSDCVARKMAAAD